MQSKNYCNKKIGHRLQELSMHYQKLEFPECPGEGLMN